MKPVAGEVEENNVSRLLQQIDDIISSMKETNQHISLSTRSIRDKGGSMKVRKDTEVDDVDDRHRSS